MLVSERRETKGVKLQEPPTAAQEDNPTKPQLFSAEGVELSMPGG